MKIRTGEKMKIRKNEWVVVKVPTASLPEYMYPTRTLRFHFTEDGNTFVIAKSLRARIQRLLLDLGP